MLNIFIKTFIFIFFISSPIYSLEIKWVVDGLNEPESAVFDKKNSAIYISNINGDPLKLDSCSNVFSHVISTFKSTKDLRTLSLAKSLCLLEHSLVIMW